MSSLAPTAGYMLPPSIDVFASMTCCLRLSEKVGLGGGSEKMLGKNSISGIVGRVGGWYESRRSPKPIQTLAGGSGCQKLLNHL